MDTEGQEFLFIYFKFNSIFSNSIFGCLPLTLWHLTSFLIFLPHGTWGRFEENRYFWHTNFEGKLWLLGVLRSIWSNGKVCGIWSEVSNDTKNMATKNSFWGKIPQNYAKMCNFCRFFEKIAEIIIFSICFRQIIFQLACSVTTNIYEPKKHQRRHGNCLFY